MTPLLPIVMSLILATTQQDCTLREDLAFERPGPPPGTYTITPDADSIQIPFGVYQGEIRLFGQVNGHDARMLVDNGALWDDLLFFGSERVDALGLLRDGKIQVGGAGSGAPILADTCSATTVSFEDDDGRTIEFQGQRGIIMPYEKGQPNPWACAEGQVSSCLFKNFVVGFDFDERIMTLVRPDAFDPAGKGVEIPIKPGEHTSWSVPGAITLHGGRRLELDMTMDLGWDEPLAINTGMSHQIDVPEGLSRTSLGSGAQGEIHGYHGTVPAIEIGGFTLRDQPTTYSTIEDGGAKVDEVLVGLGTFQHFHLILDYPGHRIFLQPNSRLENTSATPEDEGPESDSSG
ncbi:MAG: hypothetical protein V2A76_10790 [Planctomycetota bacterium]